MMPNDKFTTSETQLLRLLQKVQPNCAFDPNALCQLASKIDKLESTVEDLYKTIKVSNGNPSLVDRVRKTSEIQSECRKEMKAHLSECSGGIMINKKMVVSVIGAIIMSIGSLLLGIKNSDNKTISKDELKQLLIMVKEGGNLK